MLKISQRIVPPEGFEPPTTVPKTGMISISPRVLKFLLRKLDLFYTIFYKFAFNHALAIISKGIFDFAVLV